jgi:hypothetical protein
MCIPSCICSSVYFSDLYLDYWDADLLYVSGLEDAEDLLSDEPLFWLEGLELPNVSWLDADVLLLYCQLVRSESSAAALTHPLSSRSTILDPDTSWGFQMVQLRFSLASSRQPKDSLLETLKVNIDSGTITVVELQIVVGELGKDTTCQSLGQPSLTF